MNIPKDEKLQVLLSSTDHAKLKNIILQYAIKNGKLVTLSSYVRELIRNHIIEHEGDQLSFANEDIKKIIKQTEEKNKKDNE